MTGFEKTLQFNTENSIAREHDHSTFVTAVEEATQRTLENGIFLMQEPA